MLRGQGNARVMLYKIKSKKVNLMVISSFLLLLLTQLFATLTSDRLSAEATAVVVHYSGHESAAQQIVQRIEASKGKAIAVQADLSQSDRVTALFDRAEQQFGKPDILVNVAGIRLISAIRRYGR